MTSLIFMAQRGLINPDGSPLRPPPNNKPPPPKKEE